MDAKDREAIYKRFSVKGQEMMENDPILKAAYVRLCQGDDPIRIIEVLADTIREILREVDNK